MSEPNLMQIVEVARKAIDAASSAAMKHFQTNVHVEWKIDKTPVTRADRESEAAILSVLKEHFPSHAVLTEESGTHAGDAECRWIVDPIDGTRGFTRGGNFWGPLLGFEYKGEIVAGAMALPALKETYWAGRGLGAWCNGERLRVSEIVRAEDATLSLGQISGLVADATREPVLNLIRDFAHTRGYGDLASAAMVLVGRAEVWLETGVQPWDLAPLKILAEEAGGRFTDFDGRPTIHSGNAILSNGHMHARALSALVAR
jgi:histidinol-phosphatase